VIRHTGAMARFMLGEINGERSARVQALADALRAAGVDHQVSADIQRDIWEKMMFLASLAGLTALVRLPIGPIREDNGMRATRRAR
jgi:2-dehydropantoate 2-reductase